MKKLIRIVLALGLSTWSVSAQEVKTQEQSIHESVATVYGSTLRIRQISREECGNTYQGSEKVACEKGYDDKDKQLNQPASH